MADGPLAGKVAIVTGAGSTIGIGRAMSLALVGAGARVTMTDINKETLEESANVALEIGGDDSTVDLPEPDGPMMAVISPRPMERSTPFNAATCWLPI